MNYAPFQPPHPIFIPPPRQIWLYGIPNHPPAFSHRVSHGSLHSYWRTGLAEIQAGVLQLSRPIRSHRVGFKENLPNECFLEDLEALLGREY